MELCATERRPPLRWPVCVCVCVSVHMDHVHLGVQLSIKLCVVELMFVPRGN